MGHAVKLMLKFITFKGTELVVVLRFEIVILWVQSSLTLTGGAQIHKADIQLFVL